MIEQQIYKGFTLLRLNKLSLTQTFHSTLQETQVKELLIVYLEQIGALRVHVNIFNIIWRDKSLKNTKLQKILGCFIFKMQAQKVSDFRSRKNDRSGIRFPVTMKAIRERGFVQLSLKTYEKYTSSKIKNLVYTIIIIIIVYRPQFPTPWVGRDMSCLNCFLSSAISSVMFNFLMSSSTTLLQVFFGLPTGLLPSTSSSIALLSMLFSSLRFT